MDTNGQIKAGIVISYISIFINIITGLFYTPWMISSLGRENFGLYTLASSVITFFMFDFGLSSAITRFVSKYLTEGKIDKANNCIGIVYRMYLYLDIFFFLILLAIFFFIPEIYQKLSLEEIDKFKVVYVIAAVYSVIAFPFIPLNGILSANEKFVPLQTAELLQKIIIVVLMSVCLICGYGLYALVLVNAIAGLSTILIKFVSIRKFTNSEANLSYWNKIDFREIITFSGWSTVVSLSQRFILAIVPSVLGILSGSTAIAIFGIAMTLEGYSYTFSSVIGGPFLPKVTRVLKEDESGLLPLMIKVGRIQYIAVGAIVIGFLCFGESFVVLWVGNPFRDSFICAALMIVPSFLMTPEDIANQAILANNKVKYQAIAYAATSILNIVALCLLAELWGAIGAALSVFISYLCRWLLLNLIYYKKLHINVMTFYRESLMKMSPSFILTILFGIAINRLFGDTNWQVLIIKLIFFATIYTLCVFVFSTRYEKELLFSPFAKFKKTYDNYKNNG